MAGGSSPPIKATLVAQRKWTIFVVPHTHLDVGYTDYQGKVAETQARVLTQAANLIHEYPDFRFSMDGSWNLEQFLDTRPEAKQKEILDLIRSGKMAMPVQYCNLLTGYASLETLYQSLYESKRLSTRYGLPFEYANITDVPTYSGSYPSVLAASGVKYWVAASNNDRAPSLLLRSLEREVAVLVGRPRRQQGPVLVFTPLHAGSDALWTTAAVGRSARVFADLSTSLFKSGLQA